MSVGWRSRWHSATRRRSPSRERRDVGVPRGQAEGVHRHLHRAVHVPGARGVDLVLDPSLLVDDLVHLRLGEVLPELHRQLLETVDERLERRDRLLDVLLDVLRGVEHRLLREMPDAGPFGGEGLAGEVPVEAGHDPQEGRLAGAVRPEDADLGVREELEPDALEDLLALRGDLPQVLHGEDELRHGPVILPQP